MTDDTSPERSPSPHSESVNGDDEEHLSATEPSTEMQPADYANQHQSTHDSPPPPDIWANYGWAPYVDHNHGHNFSPYGYHSQDVPWTSPTYSGATEPSFSSYPTSSETWPQSSSADLTSSQSWEHGSSADATHPETREHSSSAAETPGYDLNPVDIILPESWEVLKVYVSAQFPEKAKPNSQLRIPGAIATTGFIPGDGNCQFRAISYLLYEDLVYHEQVRSKIVDQLKKEYRFVDSMLPDRETYLAKMAKVGTWGDEITLAVAADLFDRHITVLSLDSTPYFVLHGKLNYLLPALIFKDRHYELLLRKP